MSGIWAQMAAQDPGDPTLSALDQAARQPIGPWDPSAPLPLPEIDWGLTVGPHELSQGQEWPPTRFEERQKRLYDYRNLARGDISSLIDVRQLSVASVGPTNIFRRLSKFVSDLLVREQPTAGQDGGAAADIELARLLHTASTQATSTGLGAMLFARTSAGPMIRSLLSEWVYPTHDGGWLVVEPRNIRSQAALTFIPDAMQVTVVNPDGSADLLVLGGTPTGVGTQITVGPVTTGVNLGTAMVMPTLALPEQAEGRWGTSWYEDLLTIVVQKARAMARGTMVLDGNSDPLLILRGNLDNYTSVPGVPTSTAVAADNDPQKDAAVARRLRRIGPLLAPSGVESAEYVTWDGSLESNEGLAAQIDRDFRLMSGMPALLEADGERASGISLRREFWQFDAAVAPLYNGLHDSATRGLDFLGLGPFEWANSFEAIEDAPMMNAREDVENEGEARRGEGNAE